MKKALLHVCCAPCMIYPYERMGALGFEVEGFFYNPNIHPFAEYSSRKAAVEDLAARLPARVSYPAFDPKEFFREIHLHEAPPQRCLRCWGLRLRAAAKEAAAKGFDCFTSTLLVSPYQDQDALKALGEEAAKEAGTEFYYEDFRPGFRAAHAQAREMGIYCQKYCGCIHSEMERFARRPKK